MSRYSRLQEDRMEEHWNKAGFDLVEDTGRRTTGVGDKIIKHHHTGLTIVADHKSTRNREGFRITKEQLEKIAEEAESYGTGLPAITFSFLGHRKVYTIFAIEDLKGVLS